MRLAFFLRDAECEYSPGKNDRFSHCGADVVTQRKPAYNIPLCAPLQLKDCQEKWSSLP